MDKMTSVLLMLVVLGGFVYASQAVKCYSCALCDEPTGECTGEICLKVDFESEEQSVTSRDCSTRAQHNYTGCRTGTFKGVSSNVCACDTDLCNGAVMTSSFGHVIVAVALAINLIIGYLM